MTQNADSVGRDEEESRARIRAEVETIRTQWRTGRLPTKTAIVMIRALVNPEVDADLRRNGWLEL